MSKSNMVQVYGINIDRKTKCIHYHSPLDFVAIKFKCCNRFYACYECHKSHCTKELVKWGEKDVDHKAIFCSSCKMLLILREYFSSRCQCMKCQSRFNPKCALHDQFYYSSKLLDSLQSLPSHC